MGCKGGLQGTRPAAAAVLGISHRGELSLLGFQMHTANRSACHPCSNRVSATSRTAVYGPVRTVVWEGRSREAPPYPDQSPSAYPVPGKFDCPKRAVSRFHINHLGILHRRLSDSGKATNKVIANKRPPEGRVSVAQIGGCGIRPRETIGHEDSRRPGRSPWS